MTINRVFGSGGGEIAHKLGERLGVKVYNKIILHKLEEEYHLTWEELEHIKGQKIGWWEEFCRFYKQFGAMANSYQEVDDKVTSLQVYQTEKRILQKLAERESCIILGRSGFHIFRKDPTATKILILADEDARVERVMSKTDMKDKDVRKLMVKIDKARETYTQSFAQCSRYDARNYDLVVNVTGMNVADAVEFIYNFLKEKGKV